MNNIVLTENETAILRDILADVIDEMIVQQGNKVLKSHVELMNLYIKLGGEI
jgi:hypothetical protein